MEISFRKRVYRVNNSREASVSGELTVKEGDILKTVNKNVPDELNACDWYFCIDGNGIEGLVRTDDIEDVEDKEEKKILLKEISQKLCKHLSNAGKDSDTYTKEIARQIDNKGSFLLYFVKEMADDLESEVTLALEVSNKNINVTKTCASKVNELLKLLKNLGCDDGLPCFIVDYFTQALDEWICKILCSETEVFIYISVHLFEPTNGDHNKLETLIEEFVKYHDNEEKQNEEIILQCATFFAILWHSSEIMQAFQKQLKKFTKEQQPRRSILNLCLELAKQCPQFANKIEQDEELFKIISNHKLKIEQDKTTHANGSQVDTPEDWVKNDGFELPPCDDEEEYSLPNYSIDKGNLSQGTKYVLETNCYTNFTEGLHFSIDQKLNRGGQAKTFIVDVFLGRKMVLKEFLNTNHLHVISNEFGKLLMCEDHDHILKVCGLAFRNGDQGYALFGFLAEYMKLGSLDKYYEKKEKGQVRFSGRQIIQWFIQIASALEYLHSKNLVHRDVKPANILLKTEEHALLADFGFMKRTATDAPIMTCSGTPRYQAPEVRGGKPYSTPADVFSLGITFREIITLKRRSTQRAHFEKTYRNLFPIENDEFKLFVDLLFGMCKYHPEERPTMKEVREKLENVAQNLHEEVVVANNLQGIAIE